MNMDDKQGFKNFGGGGGALRGELSQSLIIESLSENRAAAQVAALGFTLAEMMVVLLIASIILACMAPVMTTKMKADQSIQTSPWKWVQQGAGRNVDAYFGNGDLQMAYIGQTERSDDNNAKLIINSSNTNPFHISFNQNGFNRGRLQVSEGGIYLGSGEYNGRDSIAIGRNVKVNEEDNIAIGFSAEAANLMNTAIGSNSYASGISSTVIGAETTAIGANSVAIGISNRGNASNNFGAIGNDSVAIGHNAAAYDNAVAIGAEASGRNEHAVVIGNGATVSDVGGVAVGDGAMASSAGTSIGPNASALGNFSIAIGLDAAAGTETTSINYGNAIAIGNNASALNENTIAIGTDSNAGTSSIMIGSNAGKANTSGYQNTVIGSYAFINNTTGFGNVAFGTHALNSNKTSNYNTALGHYAGSSASGANNIMIGAFSAQNLTGSNNIAIGSYACNYVKGSNKICIGNSSGPSSSDNLAKQNNTDKVVFLGDASTTVYIPGTLIVGSRSYLGYNPDKTKAGTYSYNSNDSALFVNMGSRYDGNGQAGPVLVTYNEDARLKYSDRRLKYVGKENNDGLAKLRQLKVFNYTFKKDKTKTPRVGVIAQDLQKIFPNAVKKGADGFLTIRMEDMFYAVINAIKELDAKYKAHENRIMTLEKENKELRIRLEKLESKLK